MGLELRTVFSRAAAGIGRHHAKHSKKRNSLVYEEVVDLEDSESQHGTRKRLRYPSKLSKSRVWPIWAGLVFMLGAAFFLRNAQAPSYYATTEPNSHPASYYQIKPLSTGGGRPAARKAVVFGAGKRENSTWVSKMPLDWTVYPTEENAQATNTPSTALSYLDWLIANYRNLPAYVVFAHGDYQSWHQPAPLPDLMRALDLAAVQKHGWLNLRCSLAPSCTAGNSWLHAGHKSTVDEDLSHLVKGILSHIYRPTDLWYSTEKMSPDGANAFDPSALAAPLGSQFAVSRLTIWMKPLTYWQRVREPLLMAPAEMDAWWPGHRFTSEQVEAAYEKLWHYLFLLQPVACLEEAYCQQGVFQGRIYCENADKLHAESTLQEIEALGCGYQTGMRLV